MAYHGQEGEILKVGATKLRQLRRLALPASWLLVGHRACCCVVGTEVRKPWAEIGPEFWDGHAVTITRGLEEVLAQRHNGDEEASVRTWCSWGAERP